VMLEARSRPRATVPVQEQHGRKRPSRNVAGHQPQPWSAAGAGRPGSSGAVRGARRALMRRGFRAGRPGRKRCSAGPSHAPLRLGRSMGRGEAFQAALGVEAGAMAGAGSPAAASPGSPCGRPPRTSSPRPPAARRPSPRAPRAASCAVRRSAALPGPSSILPTGPDATSPASRAAVPSATRTKRPALRTRSLKRRGLQDCRNVRLVIFVLRALTSRPQTPAAPRSESRSAARPVACLSGSHPPM
jgi:hypothetical protein